MKHVRISLFAGILLTTASHTALAQVPSVLPSPNWAPPPPCRR
jgi:hypothetical protein